MYRKVEKYIPSEEDKKWLNDNLDMLVNNGKIITDLVVYKKIEDVIDGIILELVCINPVFHELGFGMFEVNMEVLRMKTTCKAIGVKFIDNRKEVWN